MKRALGLLLLVGQAQGLAAFSSRIDLVEADRLRAAEFYRQAQFGEAAALLEAGAAYSPASALDWVALLVERQGQAAAESALKACLKNSATAKALGPQALLWLARSQADQARWEACLQSLVQAPAWPETAALKAEALAALGRKDEAKAAFLDAAGASWPGKARHLLKAADFFAARDEKEEAERLYKACEAEDASYSQVQTRLARLYAGQGRVRDAKIRFDRALGVDVDDAQARSDLNGLLAKEPGLRAQAKEKERADVKRFIASACPQVVARPARAGEKLVRVGLLDLAPSFKLRLGGAMAVSASADEGLAQGLSLPAGAYQVALRGSTWELRHLDGEGQSAETVLSFRHALRLQPLDTGSTFGVFDVAHGAGYFWAGREHRYYRGVAELRPQAAKGVTLVNELGMEAYLLSVVPSEAWAQWPAEALKAQAIAARTDSWRKLGSSSDKGYDLCPTVQCAVYRGVTAEDERTSAAVLATTGQVLEGPQAKLAPTFYMNNSGGHTQEPREAWKYGETFGDMAVFDGPATTLARSFFPVSPASLLRFIDDHSGEVESWSRRSGGSTWRWVMSYTRTELSRFVRRRHPIGDLLSVEPLERSRGGYVRQVRFSGTEGSTIGGSDRIRSAIKGLKSNLFTVETRRDPAGLPLEFIFRGAGWGHGVGMSQSGAAGMAEAGFKAAAILSHYFGGAKVKKRYG